MNTQIGFLLLLGFVTATAAGSSVLSMSAMGGVGPAAAAAGVYILMLQLAAAAGLVLVVAPYTFISGVTLLFAVLAGYRYLRWMRILGILTNLAGIGYFYGAAYLADATAGMIWLPFCFLPLFNIILFLLMPKRPSVYLTRKCAYLAIPILYAAPVIVVIAALLSGSLRPGFGATLFLLALLGLYTLPFYYVLHAVPATKPPYPELGKRLLWSVLVTVLLLLILFPLGLPLAIGVVLLLELAEISLLYPQTNPSPESIHYWIVKYFGRLARNEDNIPAAIETEQSQAGGGNPKFLHFLVERLRPAFDKATSYLERIASNTGKEKNEE